MGTTSKLVGEKRCEGKPSGNANWTQDSKEYFLSEVLGSGLAKTEERKMYVRETAKQASTETGGKKRD